MPDKITIESFSDYTKYVEQHCLGDVALFRGQQADWPLLPKLARIDLKGDLIETEAKMMAAFRRQSLPHLRGKDLGTPWDWLSLAQHHGLATRLLDWSTNPLASLWFAVGKPAIEHKPGVLWVFVPATEDRVTTRQLRDRAGSPYKLRRTMVFQPNQVTNRIVSQGGWFTVHKYQPKANRFVRLEKNTAYKKKLTKLEIPAAIFPDIRFQLDRFGVNQASMFPDLDGVSGHVQWMHTRLVDE